MSFLKSTIFRNFQSLKNCAKIAAILVQVRVIGGIGASICYDVERRTKPCSHYSQQPGQQQPPQVFFTSNCRRDVTLALPVQQQKKCRGRYFPSQTAILRWRLAWSQEKEKEMGGFCLTEASEMGTMPVFSAELWAFQKGRFRSFSRFGRWEKSPHFKDMAKDLCLSFTTVNRLVLRGTEKNIEFQATYKKIHKSENRGEKSHAVSFLRHSSTRPRSLKNADLSQIFLDFNST